MWDKIGDTIIKLEREAFGDKSFTIDYLKSDFINPNNIVILLKEKNTEKIIGFTYAKPIEEAEPDRKAEKGETAYIWDTIIDKAYQGRHLVGIMMDRLEEELRKRNYKFIERNSLLEKNYADNVVKHYKDRIVKSEPIDSIWGKQIFFRIRL